MTTSSVERPSASQATQGRGAASQLATAQGNTTIADSVVAKIAGIAARQVSGVYELGAAAGRALSTLKEKIPVGGTTPNVAQGVSVEVGERQAAVDLSLVVEYGVAIADVANSVRRNVIGSVQRMTGLEVTEVNIQVNDIHLPDEDRGEEAAAPEPRVQ
jgi:uncharacterized alkaline shock family protein YloU